jgi:hypothetical protein
MKIRCGPSECGAVLQFVGDRRERCRDGNSPWSDFESSAVTEKEPTNEGKETSSFDSCSPSDHSYRFFFLASTPTALRRPPDDPTPSTAPSFTFPTSPLVLIKMSLSRHVNAEKVLAASREHHSKSKHAHTRPSIGEMLEREEPQSLAVHPLSDRYGSDSPLPKYSLPSKGVDAKDAYALVNAELSLDGNPLYVFFCCFLLF